MFSSFSSSTSSSRIYTDLVFSAAAKWANWDPPVKINLGDYGVVNKKTGQFEVEGNIYSDDAPHDLRERVAQNEPPAAQLGKEDKIVVCKGGSSKGEFKVETNIKLDPVILKAIEESTIKGQWKFGKSTGALLLAAEPQMYTLPTTLYPKLKDAPTLQGKSLVTEVTTCPAYSLYLSNATEETLTIAFLKLAKTAWYSENAQGLYREAYNHEGRDDYTILFNLRHFQKPGFIPQKWRGPVVKPADIPLDEGWYYTVPPWDPLDENGEEEAAEDEVFDPEFE